MTKMKFYKQIADEVSKILGDEMVVELQEVTKINVSLDGLTIRKQGEAIAPTIYLNKYYSQFNDGREISDIVGDIIEVYENNRPENLAKDFVAEEFFDFERVKEKIVLKVINTAKNTELLKKVPNISVSELPLSVVFYVTIMTDKDGYAGILIKNEHLKLWNKTVSDLLNLAKENTDRIHSFTVRSIQDVMSEMFGFEDEMMDEMETFYVLTDENKTFGASQLYLKTKIKEFAQKVNTDLYILPSSVHELLLLRADFPNVEPEHLKQMVCEVNNTELLEEDFLCDGAFKYILSEDKIIAL